MKYVTTGTWGTGLGTRLTAADVDGNFYELRSDVDALIADPPTAVSIYSIAQSGSRLSVTLTDSTVLGPFYLPTLSWRWRADGWRASQVYQQLDTFSVEGVGIVLVLQDHSSASSFDIDAAGAAVTAGSFVVGDRYVIASVGTTDFTAIGASANTVGVEFAATGAGTGTGTATPKLYKLLVGSASVAVLDDISDVTITTPSFGDVLVYSGGVWVNQAIAQALSGLTDVSLSSPASGEFLKYNGTDWVNATIVQSLSGLTDVTISTPSDGDSLVYDSASGEWVNQAVVSGINQLTGDVIAGPGTGSQAATLANSGVTAGSYKAANFTVDAKGRLTAAADGELDDLSDVTITTPAAGELLQYDGAAWANVAGSAISGLTSATTPLDTASLLEVSEPTGGTPAYASKRATIADVLARGGITLGSTSVALGSTVTTLSGLTLSGATLSGATALPGGGSIASSGEIGIGGSPSQGALDVRGSSASYANVCYIAGTFQSTNTSLQTGVRCEPTFSPAGASLGSFYGMYFNPTITGSVDVTNVFGFRATINTAVGYTATTSNIYIYYATDPNLQGSHPASAVTSFFADALTNGNNLASGSVLNRGVNVSGATAGSAGGAVTNYGISITLPSGGSSSGSTINRGLFISGSGGSASGGTVTNHAIYNSSTSDNYFAGNVGLGMSAPQAALSLGTGKSLRSYNSFTDSSNGEWYEVTWASNVASIGTNKNGTGTARALALRSGGTEGARLFANGDLRQGTGSALATTAADGFFMVSACAGTPTGTPTNAGAGQIPLVYDTTNNKLYSYNGGWKSVTLS